MVAAAATLWLMFSIWLIAPYAGLGRLVARTAAALLLTELVALLVWSYGADFCTTPTCAPLAQAAGVAARTDVPLLAGVFLALALIALLRPAATQSRRLSRH